MEAMSPMKLFRKDVGIHKNNDKNSLEYSQLKLNIL
jgi:hypothetical protein